RAMRLPVFRSSNLLSRIPPVSLVAGKVINDVRAGDENDSPPHPQTKRSGGRALFPLRRTRLSARFSVGITHSASRLHHDGAFHPRMGAADEGDAVGRLGEGDRL